MLSNKFVRSTFIYTISNAFNSLIPILLLPFLIHYLSPDEYGHLAIFSVLSSIFTAIVGFGTHGAITREFFLDEKKQFTVFVGTCLFILIFSSILVMTGIILFSRFQTSVFDMPWFWLIAPLMMAFGQILSSIGLTIFQIRQLPLIYSFFQISSSLLNIFLSLGLVIWLDMGWQGRVISQVISSITLGIMITMILKHTNWITFSFSYNCAKRALRYGIPLVFYSLGVIAFTFSDRVFLANMIGFSDTGIYLLAIQLTMGVTFFADSFGRAYVPWLFDKLKNNNFANKRTVVILIYWFFFFLILLTALQILITPMILELLSAEKYYNALKYLFWLSIASCFAAMYGIMTLFIQFTGKTELLSFISILTGGFNILFCYIFIKWHGTIGAAQAAAASALVMFVISLFTANKLIKFNWKLNG